jgi:phosphoribosylamine--glycine ligase
VRVLVVGSGGREHALAWKIAQSAELDELHAAPGNPGIARLGTCHPVRADDADAVLALARALEVDLVVIGPEAPLVAGVADALRRGGIAAFGPGAGAAAIEGSKTFAKEVMKAAGVPTAQALAVAKAPCVVKSDGLAAGKGVFVCLSDAELQEALEQVRRLGGRFLIEELLEGKELSVFALCDGRDAVALAAARDYKRIGDDDSGPNTGGMGSYSPVEEMDGVGGDVVALVEQVHRPVLSELAARSVPFSGLLYAGLMLTDGGPRVLEFNCRFGDPETQSVLPCVDGDLLPALAAAAMGDLSGVRVGHRPGAAVSVVMAAGRYPAAGDIGSPIDGIDEAESDGALVFHAGTAKRDGRIVTNGGRILAVTGTGGDLEAARSAAYAAVERISFAGARYRRDIARV